MDVTFPYIYTGKAGKPTSIFDCEPSLDWDKNRVTSKMLFEWEKQIDRINIQAQSSDTLITDVYLEFKRDGNAYPIFLKFIRDDYFGALCDIKLGGNCKLNIYANFDFHIFLYPKITD